MDRSSETTEPGGPGTAAAGATGSARSGPARSARPALAGGLQSLAIVAAFVAGGLVLALAARARLPSPRPEPYPAAAMDPAPPQSPPRRWLVDGYNVLHVGILQGRTREGWWSDEGRSRLLERLAGFEEPGAELWVVFDGPRPTAQEAEEVGAGLRVVFSPSADAWLLAEVRAAADPATLVVVTADRRLADRLRHRGARVVAPMELLRRCGV